MRRPKLIPQLYEAINAQDLAQTSGVVALLFTALKADVEKLHGLFANLETLAKSRAVSSPGLEILVQMVIICQHIHDRRILHQVLARSPRLDPGSKASIALNINKLSRYFSVSRFLLEAARKYSIFRKTRISAVYLRAPNLPTTELDSMTTALIHRLLDRPKPWKLTSKFHDLSITATEDHLRQEATLAFPVHAEVQLLFHYEQKSCNIPPRIICSSKQACFLCDLFFKIHGKFTIPSSHGRLYEKWALPEAVKSTTSADKDIFTKLRSFVSAIENALLRETQPARKSYPDPYESIILHSAVWSQPINPRSALVVHQPVKGLCGIKIRYLRPRLTQFRPYRMHKRPRSKVELMLFGHAWKRTLRLPCVLRTSRIRFMSMSSLLREARAPTVYTVSSRRVSQFGKRYSPCLTRFT